MAIRKSKRMQLAWRLVFFALLILISWAALRPTSGTSWFPGQDKVVHASAYAVLYFLGWLSFPGSAFRVYLFGGLVAFGVVIEVLQHFTGYRFLEFFDVVANALGLVLGCFVVFACTRFLPGVVSVISGVQNPCVSGLQQQKEHSELD